MPDFEIREARSKRLRAKFSAAVDPADTGACVQLLVDEVAARRLGDPDGYVIRSWVGRRRTPVEYPGRRG